jgi:hypothetical protein
MRRSARLWDLERGLHVLEEFVSVVAVRTGVAVAIRNRVVHGFRLVMMAVCHWLVFRYRAGRSRRFKSRPGRGGMRCSRRVC